MKKIKEVNYKAVTLFLIIVLLILAGLFLKRCNKPAVYVPINMVKEMAVKDSFRTVIKYHDSTRIHHLNKWRNITHINDSTPCYTEIKYIIAQCDTVIKYDSILIVALRGQHVNDTIIQTKQDSIIIQKSDSITILKRKLKWAKLKTKGVIALWILREGAGVATKIKP
jgi:hypothetical protein